MARQTVAAAMLAPRRALLLALVVATPMLAGCNFSQWAKQEGTVNIFVQIQPTGNMAQLNQFQYLKIGIVGANIKQVQAINGKDFSYPTDPKVVEMVEMGRQQGSIKVASTSMPIRAIEAVTVRIDGIEAKSAAGQPIDFCYPGQKGVTKPCISTPQNGAYIIGQHNIAIPRGGTIDVYFPLILDFGDGEYFIKTDDAYLREVKE